jgi:NAD(P)-dependent dehydrogenase (short-subunit alcohol dehydrogenase family)
MNSHSQQEGSELRFPMAWTANDIPDLDDTVAVVTGANSGLGFEAARELARNGATVVMGVRSLERGRTAAERIRAEIPPAELEPREVDLGSLDAVRAFAEATLAEHDRIDMLINNAGLMATPAGETKDGFETQIGVNHLGHFVLTERFMPALERAPAARVVTLTSVGRYTGRPLTDERIRLNGDYGPWRAYGDSKLANYQFGMELARRLAAAGSNVSSLVADPGLSHTNLQVATVENAGGGIQGRFWRTMARYGGMPPTAGVLPVLRAATDPDARNGELYRPRWGFRGAPVKAKVSQRLARPADTERMWRTSESHTDTVFNLGS